MKLPRSVDRTGLGDNGCDRNPPVILLWGDISQSRVSPLPIIEAFDKLKDRTARLVMSLEDLVVQLLALQGGKEAPSQGVIVAIAGRAHGALHAQGTYCG
jgi:hypothetical protein